MQYLNEVDKVLTSKGLPKLTDAERNIMHGRCTNEAFNWKMQAKATDKEYALKKQLTIALSNVIYDTLVETRNYK